MGATKFKYVRMVTAAATLALLTGCNSLVSPLDMAVEGNDAATLMRVGDTTRESGDPYAAIAFYQQAHSLSPLDSDIMIALGDTLAEVGDHDAAIEAYNRARVAGDGNAKTLVSIGNSLTVLNRPELAIVKFEEALTLAPNAPTYNSLGVALDTLGESDKAQQAYRAGLALEAENRLLGNNLGLSLALSGNYDEAIEVLETLVELSGATPQHRQNLALAHGLAGNFARAAQLGRVDLDEAAVVRNLSYYRVLKAMDDHGRKALIVGIMSDRGENQLLQTAAGPGI